MLHLVSGIKWSGLVIHISIIFQILFSYGLQNIEYVLYSRYLLIIYVIYKSVYFLIHNS